MVWALARFFLAQQRDLVAYRLLLGIDIQNNLLMVVGGAGDRLGTVSVISGVQNAHACNSLRFLPCLYLNRTTIPIDGE
jgi:hypothetical protein